MERSRAKCISRNVTVKFREIRRKDGVIPEITLVEFINWISPKLISDITRRLIKTLVNEEKDAGYHAVTWNGKDNNDQDVSSGLYIYRIEADGSSQTKSCLLLK